MKFQYATNSWDIIDQYKAATNVVTKSTLINIVKRRAQNGDRSSLRAWLTTILYLKFPESIVENMIMDTFLAMNKHYKNKPAFTPIQSLLNNSREVAYLLQLNMGNNGRGRPDTIDITIVFMLYYEILHGNMDAYDMMYSYLKWGKV